MAAPDTRGSRLNPAPLEYSDFAGGATGPGGGGMYGPFLEGLLKAVAAS